MKAHILTGFCLFFSAFVAPLASAAEWEPMLTELLKTEKLGFGGLTGVVADRQTGDVFIWLSDKGLYRSTDQAKTFQPAAAIKGRTETPGCMLTNPAGPLKTWVIATVYGGPIVSSVDGSAFVPMDKKSGHVDWVAVDWTDPERRFVLTLKHESGGLLLASEDGGKSFREIGKNFGPACIFDSKTAVVVQIIPAETKKSPQRALARTTDGGASFEKVADFSAKALPAWFDKTPYWLVDGAVITSKDQGKTWGPLGPLKGGIFGPIFGKDDKHLFVTTAAGVVESKDGGKTWAAPIAPPKDFKGIQAMTWLAFDAKNDILYLSKMGSDLYRLKR
jgi:hypothetical protein